MTALPLPLAGRGIAYGTNRFFLAVMAGLVPAIHVFSSRGNEDVDARDKPGHDEFVGTPIASNGHMRLPY
ncbi:hypothetical protein, partial [Bradyrhizobium sp. BRP56]|uniref:hypothetical protein n=1 Tax=Bradyrhizobium sp. BRP56 TaxID=2793819 RepID=UPI001CD22C1F